MISNIDLTTANDNLMSMEIDHIKFSQLDVGEKLNVEIAVYDVDTNLVLDSWYNTYYADSRGEVLLADLARVWNNYILYRRRVTGEDAEEPSEYVGGIKVVFVFTQEDETTTTLNRWIWYSTRQDGKTVDNLNAVLPFLSLSKRTFAGAAEMVQLIGIAQSSLTVVANYVKNGVESSVTYTAEVEDSNAFGVCYWVSPSDVQTHIPSGARLVGYETRYGYSVCKYEVEDGNYAQKSQFLYLNRWGVYESLWCIGSEKWNINRSAEIGLSGGELTALDIDVDDTYEVSTGYVNDSVLEQLRDLAESPLVWLLDNSTYKKVAIDGVKMERVLPSNEARTATITYRYANRNM